MVEPSARCHDRRFRRENRSSGVARVRARAIDRSSRTSSMHSAIAVEFSEIVSREEAQMKNARMSAGGLALVLSAFLGAVVVVAQDQASKSKNEQKAPEEFCGGPSQAQIALSNAP